MSARILDVTPEQYHADPCETPSLSASAAKDLILQSPLHAWQFHPRLGKLPRKPSDSMDDGTLIHALLLGKGMERIAVLDVKDFKTNAAKELRDAALAEGKCVVKVVDYGVAVAVAAKLKERIAKFGIAFDGLSEQCIEWTEPTEEEGDVLCRSMLDHATVRYSAAPSATIYDVKTIRSADALSIQRAILNYGYDIQEAAYRSAVSALVPDARGRIDFVFLFAEIEPPFAVRPKRLTGMWQAMGQAKWDRAVRTWARCLKAGTDEKHWPAYETEITEIDPPPWALTG